MKALRLNKVGPLELETVPLPEVVPHGARLKVLSSYVLSFTETLMHGHLPFPLPTPYTPGPSCIGIVEETAPDVFDVQKGDLVVCDPFIASHTNSAPPDGILIGWFGLGPFSEGTLSLWKNGSFAEHAMYPAECMTKIPPGLAEKIDPKKLVCINGLCIGYGALLKANMHPGETVIVSGSTGSLGSGIVLVALAMGATKVIAVGRNHEKLAKIKEINPDRIVTVHLGPEKEKFAEIVKTAAGLEGANVMIDALGAVGEPDVTMACINALGHGGRAVMMGGSFSTLPIPYLSLLINEWVITGSFMYPRTAPSDILRMIAAGLIDVGKIQFHEFPLEKSDDALKAARQAGPLEAVVFAP
eukprot:TRINITY_DN1238_c0_g1_i1.p1 TRINITY_DN1238_c0_g1~~TRINITY_DN1238_c0_g1_i1.p1  ORF type:complete len:357 (+),score=106.22 TRINITY_DN1238_c0_g1_i1:113-1183(+)